MDLKKYITDKQEILYKILKNNKELQRFPQAILLNGTTEMPLLEVAKFIAKSIFCDSADLACNTCISCKQIQRNEFLNLIIINGEDKSILKNEIAELMDRFSSYSIDSNKRYVYIINLAEKMTKEAINALLKFLEEPNSPVHAIITTKNLNKVLPTIISRCQVINFLPVNKYEVITNCLNLKIEEENAEILSNFYIDEQEIQKISKDKTYNFIKNSAILYLNSVIKDKKEAKYILESSIIDDLKTNNNLLFFLDLILLFLKESNNLYFNSRITLKSNEILLKNLYNSFHNIENIMIKLEELKNDLDINVNKTLILERMHHLLIKG